MAVIDATVRGGSPDWDVTGSTLKPPPHGTVLVEWLGMAGDDTGEPVQLGNFGDKSVHVSGTIGTSAVTLQGTNEVDGAGVPVNWVGIKSPDSVAISYTALPDGDQLLENFRFIRPNVSTGTGTGIKVTVYGRKNKMASGG